MTRWIYLLLIALMSGCASIPTPQERFAQAEAIASRQGWLSTRINADPFVLAAFVPRAFTPADLLTIYIEGDGFAWVTGSMPSADPSPRDPLALRLALLHPVGNAAYLARPCQFVDAEASRCPQRYWTEGRFAPEVVHATTGAVDSLKARFRATHVALVGYSGGGAVAALVSAQRNDVVRLVTVAGNLDHAAWTTHHRVRSLAGSLNAADVATRLAHLPQMHFVGSKDRVIPPELARRWPESLTGNQLRNLSIIAEADHACCWAERWPELMLSLPPFAQ